MLKDIALFNGQPQKALNCRHEIRSSRSLRRLSAREHVFIDRHGYVRPARAQGGRDTVREVLADGWPRRPMDFPSGGKELCFALVGIAIANGSISTIEEAISDYVLVPSRFAYDCVRIKDVLQMSSGVRWDETYSDPQPEVFRLGAAMAERGSLLDFVRSMVRATPPGTVCHYNSGDTQMLGQLLVAATGRSLSDYMHEKLMRTLGMNAAGYWLISASEWKLVWEGRRVADRDERFRFYVRIERPVPPVKRPRPKSLHRGTD
jgi:CubicO group peptidase (beta-lactamase class C family)